MYFSTTKNKNHHVLKNQLQIVSCHHILRVRFGVVIVFVLEYCVCLKVMCKMNKCYFNLMSGINLKFNMVIIWFQFCCQLNRALQFKFHKWYSEIKFKLIPHRSHPGLILGYEFHLKDWFNHSHCFFSRMSGALFFCFKHFLIY